ncbi:MAG: hypothetical protein H7A37_05015 [Chlamydiales bacterium]|nr:hypothetical protein [Chlamydiia bacterium]MCP5507643.1 hypothetical protein [Chlamydiales bacterium]
MVFYLQDIHGTRVNSKEKFKEITGADWVAEMKLPTECILSKMHPSNNAERDLAHLLIPVYNAYHKAPSKVYIREGVCKGRHSVHALETIPKGTIVTEYLGEWSPSNIGPSSYRWGPIDGLYFRNYGGMVEDGFPNTGAFYLYNINGVPLRVLFVALEDIHANHIVTVHYGMNHSVKVFYHDEYRLEEMSQFFHANPLEKIVKRIKQLRIKSPKELGLKNSLELESLTVKLRYLFQTPSALLHLILKGVIRSEEAFQHYRQADFLYFLLGFPFTPNARQREIIRHLKLIDTFFANGCFLLEREKELFISVRQRIFYSVFMEGVNMGGNREKLITEAFLWNAVYDAIQQENKILAEFKIEQSTQKEALIHSCLGYAKEINSSLVPWLLHLAAPFVPLSPVGT